MLNEFYRVTFRKKIYRTLGELQTDLDAWMVEYNHQRPHQALEYRSRVQYRAQQSTQVA